MNEMDERTLFERAFAASTGNVPLSWQRRLFLEHFLRGDIPPALDIPTGLGKTSVIVIWLLALARQAAQGNVRLARRLVYVVDRRAVVDQATSEAERLRAALESDAQHVKEQLRLDGPLPISTLRGAHLDNRQWLDDPAVPAIIVGTVDMIGSRLLFEGYGVSRKMRPYHAGLLGADALVILDEAHLVPPFEALLRQIANGAREFGHRIDREAKVVPAFKLLPLSATGRAQTTSSAGAADNAFRLTDDDLSDTIVRGRLSAKKTLCFVRTDDQKGSLVEALAQHAWKISKERDKPVRCLVYCDSRETAEKVKDRLDILAVHEKKADAELFVGGRRVKEREHAKSWLQDHGFLAGSAPPAKSAFLIATSAGEVGIDLDADHMVCDLVPWERMVQRLGRVNRRGAGDASIVVVHGEEPKPKKPDSPTDEERRLVVGFRSLTVIEELPEAYGGRDASPGALRALKLRAETDNRLDEKIKGATTPEPLRPALTRALIDAWSMTSLEQHTGRPDIAPWLRGWVEPDYLTTVIWRSHLPVREGIAEWPRTLAERREIEAFFEASPPHESEKLEAETFRIADWLQHRAKELLRRSGTSLQEGGDIVAFALSPDGSYASRYTLGDLAQDRKGRAKDEFHSALVEKILIVDARCGGLKGGMLDDKANDGFSIADSCDDWSKTAGFRVRRTTSNDYGSKQDYWRFEDDFVLRADSNADPELWLIVEHYKDAAQSENARSISRPQELSEHRNWAQQAARKIAAKVGLSGHAAEALAIAAFLHDEGKRASRWQRAFKASRDAKTYGLSGPLAKTRGPIDQAILDRYRHEFGSLPYAEAHVGFKALPEDWRDLVLHLIAAHHGQARPVIGTQGCEDAPPSALEDRARAVALRFAKLQKRWGPWGLAWWEALMRAADQQASRNNDVREDTDTAHTEKR
jgi:CRISPR-associated endonuclease/helicase Cas3